MFGEKTKHKFPFPKTLGAGRCGFLRPILRNRFAPLVSQIAAMSCEAARMGNVSLERLGAHILVKVPQFVGHQGFGYENQGFLWICVGC